MSTTWLTAALDNFILPPAVTIVSPLMGTQGWPFAPVDNFPGTESDPLYGSQHVKDLYLRADPDYGGRLVVFAVVLVAI